MVTYSAVSGRLRLTPTEGRNGTSDDAAGRADGGNGARGTASMDLLTVRVPLMLTDPTITPSVDSFAQRNGVPLSIERTFTWDVHLNKIRSCNKRFNVFLPSDNAAVRAFFNNKGASKFLRIRGRRDADGDDRSSGPGPTVLPLGKVLLALTCSHLSGDNSFYAYSLTWLENRE